MASIEAETTRTVASIRTKANSCDDDKSTGSIRTPSSVSGEPKPQSRDSELPIVNNVFYNEETLKYMRIIDMYKKLGIGKDIELPRLVIAGAQSCGKSSLLENLTGLPVPITTGIGTRFPIEITLIEDSKRFQTKPSIILDPKSQNMSAMDKEKVQKFNLGQVYHEPMTQMEFENLLRRASDLLGVPPPVFAGDHASRLKTEKPASQITSHVLQIEMRGKDFKSLSFVDTPGLYSAGNSDQDVNPVDEIEKLVTSLIAEKRTLIVGVMDATQPTVVQKIFKFADDVDITGERTIGVLTKCDLAVTSDTDAFEATLRVARNEDRILKHGWYVVKNRSSTETKANISLDASRDKESRLFAGVAWRPSSSGLRDDRMGIHSLRTGLSNVFCAHIRAEFPAFNQQTRTILKQKQAELAALGPARSTITEQRIYLKSIVDSYQYPKNRCLTEDFRPGLGTFEGALALERRLAVKKKTELRDALVQGGALWPFRTPTFDRSELSDAAASAAFVAGTTTSIYTWINYRYQETKSCTMPGLVPYELIERLFEEQTVHWQTITDSFVQSIADVFISAAAYCLRFACPNNVIYIGLEGLIRAEIRAKMTSFETSCHLLIEKEREGMQVIACEDQFVKEIREARTLRFISAIAKLESEPVLGMTNPLPSTSASGTSRLFADAKSMPAFGFGQTASVKPTPITGIFGTARSENAPTNSAPSAFGNASGSSGFGGFGAANPEHSTPTSGTGLFGSSNPAATTATFNTLVEFAKNNQAKLTEVLTHERQLVYEIHDILKAYYNTSVQHYTDVVCKSELNGSFTKDVMNLFSKEFIDRLSETQIGEIAAESPADRKKRRELKEDIEKLEMAISESEMILQEAVAD